MDAIKSPVPLDGLAKIRLVHAQGCSFFFVDHVLLKATMTWLQPKHFVLTTVMKTECELRARVAFDLQDETTVFLDFSDAKSPQRMQDHSWLYECKVYGNRELESKASGDWRFGKRGLPQLRLYHHTTVDAAANINQTEEFWSSPWNIQGNRKLRNVAYTYFTSLPRIKNDDDLAAIAMSRTKALHFIRDGAVVPQSGIPKTWKSGPLTQDILELPVYWSAPEMRDKTIAVYVDVDLFAPVHVLRHSQGTVWYEVVLPSVYRVGMEPGTVVRFEDDELKEPSAPKRFDYHVIGDATTLQGLAAPFDEEDTTYVFKVETSGQPPLEFWMAHANSDQYSNKGLVVQEFEE